MAVYFTRASNNRATRSTSLAAQSISLWFWPDDNAVDCSLYSEHNAAGTQYKRVWIKGASSDNVELTMTNGVGIGVATSAGTVNYNAWNHVYASLGVNDATKSYISLNGEALVTGTRSAHTVTQTAIGISGGAAALFDAYSGRMAEVALWDMCLNDLDDRYKMLSRGISPLLVPLDPTNTNGVSALNRITYLPLVNLNLVDRVSGVTWTAILSPPTDLASGTDQAHPRIFRNFME